MVLVATYPTKKGNDIQTYLKKHQLYHPQYKTFKKGDMLYSPILKAISLKDVTCIEYDSKDIPQKNSGIDLKQGVSHILTDEEKTHFKRSFDTIGTIAIVEIDSELRHKQREIAQTLLDTHPAITSVYRKESAHEGQFRTQKVIHLAGEKTTKTIHRENNTQIAVDIGKVYFSPRLANERLRIAKQVQDQEEIIHLFSGCAPYECVIAKNANPSSQLGIELNPIGHALGLENVQRNKCKHITLICGDTKTVLQTITKKFDRIIMNLPKNAYEYLDDALKLAKKGTNIHYYDFLHEDEFDIAKQRIEKAVSQTEYQADIKGIFTCGTQGVKTHRICVDVQLQ